jgi:hypothetical protein
MIRTRLRDKLASSLGSLATRIELVGSTALTPDQIRLAHRMREAGESVATICTTLRVGEAPWLVKNPALIRDAAAPPIRTTWHVRGG